MNSNPFSEKLAQFLEDEAMYHAVKQILMEQFDINKINYTQETVTNEILGQLTRACIEGRDMLAAGFKEIEKYRKDKISAKGNNINPAV